MLWHSRSQLSSLQPATPTGPSMFYWIFLNQRYYHLSIPSSWLQLPTLGLQAKRSEPLKSLVREKHIHLADVCLIARCNPRQKGELMPYNPALSSRSMARCLERGCFQSDPCSACVASWAPLRLTQCWFSQLRELRIPCFPSSQTSQTATSHIVYSSC